MGRSYSNDVDGSEGGKIGSDGEKPNDVQRSDGQKIDGVNGNDWGKSAWIGWK